MLGLPRSLGYLSQQRQQLRRRLEQIVRAPGRGLDRAAIVPTLSLYIQYVAIMCAIPVLRMFPSDIIVGVFKKKAAD